MNILYYAHFSWSLSLSRQRPSNTELKTLRIRVRNECTGYSGKHFTLFMEAAWTRKTSVVPTHRAKKSSLPYVCF